LMRVVNVWGGGGCGQRWLLSLRSSKNMLFPFKAKWSLLAWTQASWRARICRLSCFIIGSDVPSLVERNEVARVLSWATWWVRRFMVTYLWRSVHWGHFTTNVHKPESHQNYMLDEETRMSNCFEPADTRLKAPNIEQFCMSYVRSNLN